MNLFKAEFVGAPMDDDSNPVQQVAAAIGKSAVGKSSPLRERAGKSEATGDPVLARSTSKHAEPQSVRTSTSTACNAGSVSPTSSASSAQELSSATGVTSEPPSSWETQDGGARWDRPAEAISSSAWQVAYRSSHAARGHMSIGTSPEHQEPVALRPPPTLPGFTFDTTMPSLGDVARLAPAAMLPSAEELDSIEAYGTFGY